MVFGLRKKNQELEKELSYIRGQLETLLQLQKQPKAESGNNEPEEPRSKFEKVNKKLDNISWALVEKRVKALEKRLLNKENPEQNEPQNNTEEYPDINPDSFDIPSMVKSIPAPMRIALSMMLKQRYGVTLDDIVNDPTKAIPILTDVMNALNTISQKKEQAAKEGKPFNPYDPTLFVRS